ncbi:unnamed protein product [Auanema sp. JU1783]|nr:unnamed protein product [Auanema sp. JU1783]
MISSSHSFKEHFSTEVSFPQVFFKATSQFNKTALVDAEDTVGVSFNELIEMTNGYESFLFSYLKKGKEKLVVTICGNSLKFLSITLAITKLGYCVVPLNPSLKKYEIVNSLEDLEVNCIITDRFDAHKFLQKTDKLITLHEIQGCATVVPIPPTFDRSHPAFIFFSSGTTGASKGIEISHGSVIALFNQLRSSSGTSSFNFTTVDQNDKVYGVLPYFHVGGLFTTYSMLFFGATVYINDKWDPKLFLNNIVENEITTLNLVPPVLQVFEKMRPNLPHLKKVFVGASKVDPNQIYRLKRAYPSMMFIQLYGMTEVGLIMFMTPAENDDASKVGIAFPGIQAKIVNQELLIKSPTMMSRYTHESNLYNKKDWFHTGDLVECCSDNQLRIIGRKKNMIKVRAWQINPEEVEDMIAKKINVETVLHSREFKHDMKLILQTSTRPEFIRSLIQENLISYKHAFWIIRSSHSSSKS